MKKTLKTVILGATLMVGGLLQAQPERSYFEEATRFASNASEYASVCAVHGIKAMKTFLGYIEESTRQIYDIVNMGEIVPSGSKTLEDVVTQQVTLDPRLAMDTLDSVARGFIPELPTGIDATLPVVQQSLASNFSIADDVVSRAAKNLNAGAVQMVTPKIVTQDISDQADLIKIADTLQKGLLSNARNAARANGVETWYNYAAAAGNFCYRSGLELKNVVYDFAVYAESVSNKTAQFVVSHPKVVGGLALLIGGYYLYNYCFSDWIITAAINDLKTIKNNPDELLNSYTQETGCTLFFRAKGVEKQIAAYKKMIEKKRSRLLSIQGVYLKSLLPRSLQPQATRAINALCDRLAELADVRYTKAQSDYGTKKIAITEQCNEVISNLQTLYSPARLKELIKQ